MTMGLRDGGIDERLCTLIDQQVTHVLIAFEEYELTASELGDMADQFGPLENSIGRLSDAKAQQPAGNSQQRAS